MVYSSARLGVTSTESSTGQARSEANKLRGQAGYQMPPSGGADGEVKGQGKAIAEHSALLGAIKQQSTIALEDAMQP